MPLMRSGDSFSASPPRSDARPILYRERRVSEESIATELCDGPLLDEEPRFDFNQVSAPFENVESPELDRNSLIERIKQRERISLENAKIAPQYGEEASHNGDADTAGQTDSPTSKVDDVVTASAPTNAHAIIGFEIQRPRSALHSGDFSRGNSSSETSLSPNSRSSDLPVSTSPPRPGPFSTSVATPQSRSSLRLALTGGLQSTSPSISDSSLASALRSGSPKYILKTPTSPLVREASDSDLELDGPSTFGGRSRSNRRHTLTPIGSYTHGNDYSSITAAARAPASLRREGTYPIHGHQSRRSLGGFPILQNGSSPVKPNIARSRRPSFSSDASPRQSSMVGSYEESILRGRMSGAPSHPLTFEAGIGALGKDGCKPLMPEHVRIDFPAVFYSWTDGQGRVSSINQEPSPYVGRIDLESNLPPPKGKKEKRRARKDGGTTFSHEDTIVRKDAAKKRKREEARRECKEDQPMSCDLLGGAYRIPKKGSLQLIIKNPNKTAVKVFFVPYDLEGMQPMQRTWVRQRLYSTGPIVEAPISSKPSTEASGFSKNGHDKPTLRYLINFKICCPSKGRFYLYDEIRVVFANRVPDNKEKLRSEVQMPEEPKYMPFKAPQTQIALPDPPSPCPVGLSAEERAERRRSYGVPGSRYTTSQEIPSLPRSIGGLVGRHFGPETPPTPVPAIPPSWANGKGETDVTDVDTETSGSAYILSPNREVWNSRVDDILSSPETSKPENKDNGESIQKSVHHRRLFDGDQGEAFAKLPRDDARFGGYLGRSSTPDSAESLIARRLRSLEVDGTENTDGKDLI